MRLGGTIKQIVDARLLIAYAGGTRFATTRWKHCRHRWWVLDYINQGQQLQRIGRSKTFTRLSGMAAVYAPGREYRERQIAGGSVEESYIMFDAQGEVEKTLHQVVGTNGWCHFRDCDHLIGAHLHRAAELVFHRRPGFHLLAHGTLMGLLALIVTASQQTAHLRNVRTQGRTSAGNGLIGAIERFINDHIAEPLCVADLARHAKMSESAFAHVYSRLAEESPYHTVRRLKLEAAKRLLLQDGLSIKQCAERLGFSSEFHFSRLFKRLEGMSPIHYKHALMEKILTGPAWPRQINRP